MEAATGQSGGVLILLAVITMIGTLGTAYFGMRAVKSRSDEKVETASTTAAAATAEQAATQFEVLAMQRVEELHDSYNKELARLTAENQRKDAETAEVSRRKDAEIGRLNQRIQFLEERLDG